MSGRRARIAIAIALLAGCGGHHGSSPPPAAVFRVVDLATGAVSSRVGGWDPRTAADAEMVFRLVSGDGATPAFWCAVFETTQAQWAALGGAAPSIGGTELTSAAIAPRMPLFGVTLIDALARCDAYDAAHGATAPIAHRLDVPTGAQWTCAAGVATGFAWGASSDPQRAAAYAVVAETRTARGPATVGSRAANANGLYDLHGNVWELTLDSALATDAVLRGGSWRDNLVSAAVEVAPTIHDDTAHPLVGVRLVLVLP